jgi:PKD repeat protein
MKFKVEVLPSPRIRRTVICVIAVAVLSLAVGVGPASAHVMLDKPVGGETLATGSVFSIMWHETVEHGPANFDLWYSTTGPNGPWIQIASNLPPGERGESQSYDWTIPDVESNQVRFRVRQDNQSVDYDDVSQADIKIAVAADPVTVDLDAAKDATLHQENSNLANGSGSFLFTGLTGAQNGGAERRALVAFDIAGSVPAGSMITAVSLELRMSKTSSGTQTVELRRVTESWSEGSSNASANEGAGADAVAGDTTWAHRDFPSLMWATQGGSFSTTASATQQVAGSGSYTWSSTAQMVADVQGWLDDPSSNNGWLLLMPSGGSGSAKRFNSRENGSGSPQLSVTYEAQVAAAPTAGFTFDPPTPKVGETVTFTDQSTGSPTAWDWDFDDGGSSDEQNPTHVFATAGSFTVGLTASNDGGEDTITASVTVIEDEPELTEMVLVPGVANATGVGSFFVTTLDVLNGGTSTASFRLLWLPRDVDNSDPEESALFMLEPGEVRRFENVLEEAFAEEEAVGAVVVVSDSEDLEVLGRTFNQTEIGTFGQSSPGVAEEDLIPAGARALVMFMTENPDFRSNLGVASGVGIPITVMWELFDADGNSLGTGQEDLPAWGNIQLNRVFRPFRPVKAAYVHVWTDTTGGAFTCFGSVLDNDTSDPTTVMPR